MKNEREVRKSEAKRRKQMRLDANEINGKLKSQIKKYGGETGKTKKTDTNYGNKHKRDSIMVIW